MPGAIGGSAKGHLVTTLDSRRLQPQQAAPFWQGLRRDGRGGQVAVVIVVVLALLALAPTVAHNVASVCAVGGGAGLCREAVPLLCPGSECTWLSYLGQTDAAAEATLRQAASSGLAAPSAAFRLGELLLRQGRASEAVGVWRDVPYAGTALAQKAAAAASAGRMADAERLMGVSMTVEPWSSFNLGPVYRVLCTAWRTAGANSRALPWCRLALYAGGDIWAGLEATSASLAVSDASGALVLVGVVTGTRTGAGLPQAWRLTGEALTARGDSKQAVEAFRRALTLGASDPWTHVGFATALLRTGDQAGACEQVAAAGSLGYQLSAAQAVEFRACAAGGLP